MTWTPSCTCAVVCATRRTWESSDLCLHWTPVAFPAALGACARDSGVTHPSFQTFPLTLQSFPLLQCVILNGSSVVKANIARGDADANGITPVGSLWAAMPVSVWSQLIPAVLTFRRSWPSRWMGRKDAHLNLSGWDAPWASSAVKTIFCRCLWISMWRKRKRKTGSYLR